MEHSKAFVENDVIGICNLVVDHCNTYILNQQHLSPTQAYSLYAFLPLLLDRILGSPTKKGLIQYNLSAEQMAALLQLLSVHGVFLKSLFLLSQFTQYSYELFTSNLSKDVGEVLSSGSIQLLPRLYNNACETVRSKTDDAFVLRTAATSHSTLLPQNGKDNRMIRFNMVQFYLFHFVSVPTFSSPTPASFTVTKAPSSSYNTTNTLPVNASSSSSPSIHSNYGPHTSTSNMSSTHPQHQRQQSNPYSTSSQYNSHTSSPQPSFIKPGTLTHGPYKNLVRDYFNVFIPFTIQPPSSTFFFDTCVELWIRTVSIPPSGRLHPDLMYYITYFVQFIVSSDLRIAINENTWIYQLAHQEIYLLISRLLHNWSKEDDFLSVMDLWSIWASPWKFGESPKSVAKQDSIHTFTMTVLDNIPVYFQLVDVILQKASTFTFTNMRQQQQRTTTTSSTTTGTAAVNIMSIENMDDQIRILHRLTNVLYTEHLTKLLGWIEIGLYHIDAGKLLDTTPFECISKFTGLSTNVVYQKLKYWHGIMMALDGGVDGRGQGGIRKRNLYISPSSLSGGSGTEGERFHQLIVTVSQLQQAIHKMESNSIFGVAVMQRKQQLTELKKVEEKLRVVFDLSTSTIHQKEKENEMKQRSTVNNNNNAQPQPQRPKSPVQAGLQNGGFLTPEELKLVKEGYMLCSRKNVPKVGRRPRTVVRSYEWASVLMWTVNMEDKINPWYSKNVPVIVKEKLHLPDEICIRFLAAPVNWPYIIILISIFYYLVRFLFRLIFRF